MSKENLVGLLLILLSAAMILAGVISGVNKVVAAINNGNVRYYCTAVAEGRDTGFSGQPNRIFYQSPARHSRKSAEQDSALIKVDTSGLSYFYSPVRSISVKINTDTQAEDCDCNKR